MVSLWAKVLSPRGKRGGSLVSPSCIVDSIVLQYNSVPAATGGAVSNGAGSALAVVGLAIAYFL